MVALTANSEPPALTSQTLHAGGASVTIDPTAGGRLSSFVVEGHELLVPESDSNGSPAGWGAFPMIPWAGRIRRGRFDYDARSVQLPLGMPPHAIHGTTYRRPWTVDGPGSLSIDLGPEWPWPGTATQTIELGERRLSMTITVACDAAADSPMPVSAGWHPWFRRSVGGTDVVVSLPAERMWRRDSDGIPDGTLATPTPGPWDDCFTALIGPVELQWPDILVLFVESDCEHVVVYDEPAHAVCVEPQSAPPDSHNSGEDLVLVEPGESWSIHTTWIWKTP